MTDWHEAGCAKTCAEQHTYELGRCALSTDTPPAPATLVGRIETMADGQPGIVMRTIPDPDREDRIPLADLTEADLAGLYDDIDRYAEILGEMNERATRHERELAALRTVARGYCPACGRGDAAPTVQDWEQQKQRADAAEATLAEVLAAFDGMRNSDGEGDVLHYQARVTRLEYERWAAARNDATPSP